MLPCFPPRARAELRPAARFPAVLLAPALAPALALALVLAGCAHVLHEAVPAARHDHAEGGILYYESSPYLLVHADGEGGLRTTVLELPDTSKLRRASLRGGLAGQETRLVFDRGVLTRGDASARAAELAEVLAGAVETALPDLVALNAPPAELPAPALYKIVVSDGRVGFVGGEGDRPIRVSVRAPEDER